MRQIDIAIPHWSPPTYVRGKRYFLSADPRIPKSRLRSVAVIWAPQLIRKRVQISVGEHAFSWTFAQKNSAKKQPSHVCEKTPLLLSPFPPPPPLPLPWSPQVDLHLHQLVLELHGAPEGNSKHLSVSLRRLLQEPGGGAPALQCLQVSLRK